MLKGFSPCCWCNCFFKSLLLQSLLNGIQVHFTPINGRGGGLLNDIQVHYTPNNAEEGTGITVHLPVCVEGLTGCLKKKISFPVCGFCLDNTFCIAQPFKPDLFSTLHTTSKTSFSG